MANARFSPLLILLLALALASASQRADDTREKIVNGFPCPRGSQPWQVALLYDREFQCSGVLVSKQWVLTVAHCHMSEYTVHMGSDHLDDENAVMIRATESFIHPRFHSQKYIHDLMLVKLSSPAPLSETVKKPSVLRCSNVTLMSYKDCGKLHSVQPKTHMMCTTTPTRVPFAYRGDPGTPLMCEGSLQGLVSRRYVPSTEQFDLVIYTHLCLNYKWIRETMKENY